MKKEPSGNHTGIGDPPSRLSTELSMIWRELAVALLPNVGTAGDRVAFELLVGLTGKSQARTISAAETSQMTRLLNEFGLTPVSRRRLEPSIYDHVR